MIKYERVAITDCKKYINHLVKSAERETATVYPNMDLIFFDRDGSRCLTIDNVKPKFLSENFIKLVGEIDLYTTYLTYDLAKYDAFTLLSALGQPMLFHPDTLRQLEHQGLIDGKAIVTYTDKTWDKLNVSSKTATVRPELDIDMSPFAYKAFKSAEKLIRQIKQK